MITEPYHDKTLMPFGKHKGKLLADIPAHYLLWLYDTSEQGIRLSDKMLAKYIKDNLKCLNMEAEADKQKQRAQRYFENK